MVSSPPGNCPDASQDDLKGDSEMNHHDLITAPLAKFSSQVLPRGRRIKFTPERIQQIRNLVERGKSREEIAELIEVTVGSLQVTCSKLGISLRRPRLDNGIRFLPRRKPVPRNGRSTSDPSCDVSVPLQPIGEGSRQDSQPGPPEQPRYTTPHQGRPKAKEADFAHLSLTMRYKGEERTTKLALTQLAIGQLAFEAGLRDMRIGEFIGELVTATIQKNLFQRMLDIS
jgi:hypothetical protein